MRAAKPRPAGRFSESRAFLRPMLVCLAVMLAAVAAVVGVAWLLSR
jgi:hypothetical protein